MYFYISVLHSFLLPFSLPFSSHSTRCPSFSYICCLFFIYYCVCLFYCFVVSSSHISERFVIRHILLKYFYISALHSILYFSSHSTKCPSFSYIYCLFFYSLLCLFILLFYCKFLAYFRKIFHSTHLTKTFLYFRATFHFIFFLPFHEVSLFFLYLLFIFYFLLYLFILLF
jgi:hypothetical protein